MSANSLPIIISAPACARLLPLECALCEEAGSLLSQGLQHQELNDLGNAVVLCNELLWAHEGSSPSDETLHLAAEKLKCFFLSQIETILKQIP